MNSDLTSTNAKRQKHQMSESSRPNVTRYVMYGRSWPVLHNTDASYHIFFLWHVHDILPQFRELESLIQNINKICFSLQDARWPPRSPLTMSIPRVHKNKPMLDALFFFQNYHAVCMYGDFRRVVQHKELPLVVCLTVKERLNITFSWRWSKSWSIWQPDTFCCHLVREKPYTLCVLSKTIRQRQRIITHLSAAAARSA